MELLKHSNLNPNIGYPLHKNCYNEEEEILKLILQDERTDPNIEVNIHNIDRFRILLTFILG